MKRIEKLQMLAALEEAIESAGGLTELSKSLPGRPSKQTIHQWRNRRVPAERAVDIEIALNGEVKRHELRPDLFKGCYEGCRG